MHSPEELKLLIRESQEAGILHQTQQEVVVRALSIDERRIGDIMTPRHQVEWIDAEDSKEDILRTIRDCPHEQLLVGRGSIDQPLGMVLKKDLLGQALDGQPLDPMQIIREPIFINESKPVLKVLEEFKKRPVRLAVIFNEYGGFEGIVTQTDLLEAIAGDLPAVEGETPTVIARDDGSLLIDGMMPAYEALDRLGLKDNEALGDFHTIAGFALAQLGHLPKTGESFTYENWQFEIVDMDGRRIDKLVARKLTVATPESDEPPGLSDE